MPTTIHEVLDELRASATDERDKGDKFEHLISTYLQTDPVWVARFAKVWTWTNWPGRDGKPDTGIDLVAEDRETGELCAIQCKFYDESHTLQKADIDSFFTASGKAGFTSRLIVSTTDKWSKNAEDALEGQQIPVSRLRVQDLDDSAVDWSAFSAAKPDKMRLQRRKTIRPHQALAVRKVAEGFATADRGKLIMACGTGKTYTALKVVEELVPRGGSVLFLVPSISLLSQTLKEWSTDTDVPLRPFAVCSDPRAGRRTASEDIGPYDLALPASTSAAKLYERMGAQPDPDAITVVYGTYQSIAAVAEAQAMGLPDFDLIVCDEAHRTTGVVLAGEDDSHFVKVHDNSYLHASKRLYMTATPRIYADASKAQADAADALLCSMDDETIYGPELHRLGFGDAVAAGLLTDYKVLVLAVDESYVSKVFQSQLADEHHELNLDDAAKIVGCWNGLSKRGVSEETFDLDPTPMRRAVAFARSIKDSKRIAEMFTEITDVYARADDEDSTLRCEVEHVDGTFNVLRRNEKLDWLKAATPGDANLCRVLSNARCLSEGVDVPALDAVIFLNPRNSIVDVVQSVGRVMRRSEGKEYGYVILPVGVPADVTPEVALRDNQKYKVVWQVLQALRAHDDRFNAMINKIELNRSSDDTLQIIGVGERDSTGAGEAKPVQGMFAFPQIEAWRDALFAKIVTKVGDRRYWEDWARDVAVIAERHTTRIKALLADPNLDISEAFDSFLQGLQGNLNESITADDAIDMLAQHLITRPVFEALFSDYAFATRNPVSVVMQTMLDALDEQSLSKEAETLEEFYASVRLRAQGITTADGKQAIITELYEKFFKIAFPRTAESLGIVYTPVEIVDFILHSVQDVLGEQFGASLSDAGVHVLDPFTGTGTFIVRLLQSGLISPGDLARKYVSELHANEIVLLAYYIAAINIEASYHDAVVGDYTPFDGIILTDTFQMFEEGDTMDELIFPENNERVARLKNTDIRVIVGNPPYSVGQGSQNDGNENVRYPGLDGAIEATYAARSNAGLKRNLYDSYIRAFRLASNRIKDTGIVCFVSNGSWIDSGSADGFRKCLVEEFSAIYCLNLRGNQRTSGETSRREGGKVFGQGSRTPVAITLLVKNPASSGAGVVRYHDIGDYLTREQKLAALAGFVSAASVPWQTITPNSAGDWINQRDDAFATFPPLGDKKDIRAGALFETYSLGVVTGRDAWAYNFSRERLLSNVGRMLGFYNSQLDGLDGWLRVEQRSRDAAAIEDYVDRDPSKISWTRGLKSDLRKGRRAAMYPENAVPSMYRPYCKQWLYFDRQFNEMVLQVPRLFPTPEQDNRVISLNASDARKPFGAIMTDVVPNLALSDPGQCFPRYYYSETTDEPDLYSNGEEIAGYVRHDAITDATLSRYQQAHGDHVSKDDIFYAVYGLLHSPEYKSRFAADLAKMIPRIPMVADFDQYARIGRELTELHLTYESAELWALDGLPDASASAADLRVEKMRFGKAGKNVDRSTIVVNSAVALRGIPEEAYGYEVNGKPALAWIMDRYATTVEKDSGIANDPNLWSEDPRYIVDLVARITTVSIRTVELIAELPALDIVPTTG